MVGEKNGKHEKAIHYEGNIRDTARFRLRSTFTSTAGDFDKIIKIQVHLVFFFSPEKKKEKVQNCIDPKRHNEYDCLLIVLTEIPSRS